METLERFEPHDGPVEGLKTCKDAQGYPYMSLEPQKKFKCHRNKK